MAAVGSELVLICAPLGRDAQLVHETLSEAGVESTPCPDLATAAAWLRSGPVGLLVVTEEMLTAPALVELGSLLLPRPSWSDLPIILLTLSGAYSKWSLDRFRAMQALGSVTLLERPLRKVTLTMAVQAGMASRRRQYETRDFIDQLASANTDLQQFAFAASHDLQEPLRMVNSFSQLLIARYVDPENERAREFARFIKSGVQRMEALLRDLLLYSKVVHGSGPLEREMICLEELVNEARQLVRAELDGKGGMVSCGPLPCLRVNTSEIMSVFQNLISNGVKYARQEVPPVIEISSREQESEYTLCVRDNGIGFDQTYSEVVFQLFQRLHRDEAIPGTGLGLSICRRIIEKHSGKMWAESIPGIGSSFYFTLPKN